MESTIVLVHGAWADGSSWRKVIPLLLGEGHKVAAVQIPLTSFEADVEATRQVIARAAGAVTLVAHSYAGAVISAAALGVDAVKSLVYITAYGPEEGETVSTLRSRHPAHPNAPQLAPDANGMLWMSYEDIAGALAHDVKDVANLRLIEAVQKPIAVKTLVVPMPKPAWKEKPSWYLVCEDDRMASAETQRCMAARMQAKVTTLASGHMPLLTHPAEVARIILSAAGLV
jgi:pimeloyl-ACP methyl ester carboxylesterase